MWGDCRYFDVGMGMICLKIQLHKNHVGLRRASKRREFRWTSAMEHPIFGRSFQHATFDYQRGTLC